VVNSARVRLGVTALIRDVLDRLKRVTTSRGHAPVLSCRHIILSQPQAPRPPPKTSREAVDWYEFAQEIQDAASTKKPAYHLHSQASLPLGPEVLYYKGSSRFPEAGDIEEMNERSAMVNVADGYETGEGISRSWDAMGSVNAVTRYIDTREDN